MRKKEDVQKLAKNYIKQLGQILDIKKVEVRYNGEWYDKMSAEELLRLMSEFTQRRMLERDMFKERDKKGLEIGLHEPVYPVLQGYDSVMLRADATVIGSDQKFNELQGRKIQKICKQEPQDLVIMPILVGTDGKQKMSQSLGNYIGMNDAPEEMFGKIMSVPDNIIRHYYELLTDVPIEQIKQMEADMKSGKLNPRDVKLSLAFEIVSYFHGDTFAKVAQKYFIDTFSKREAPKEVLEIKVKDEIKLTDFVVKAGFAKSISDARRKIEQGGVEINGKKIEDWKMVLDKKFNGSTLKIGKHNFVRIKF
jgi:tyrosyl-tRNA synthetase